MRLMRAFGEGCCLWRFYAWSPPAMSLGRSQNPAEIDRERCRADGRIVGFRKEHIFSILWIDCKYELFDHGS
ncbi:hypothetical protein [Chlorobaculum limnaeum]|nr:hypothetical protein [Chlorobaculum limnaeum]